jgi:hypothetical protein
MKFNFSYEKLQDIDNHLMTFFGLQQARNLKILELWNQCI